jgi:Arc/MetJ-type ribon-helix-helix transcriptional regulator
MTIHLKPELEKLIQRDIQRGSYQSVEEFVERAVQMLHDEEDLLWENKDIIHDEIGRGLTQLIVAKVFRTRYRAPAFRKRRPSGLGASVRLHEQLCRLATSKRRHFWDLAFSVRAGRR